MTPRRAAEMLLLLGTLPFAAILVLLVFESPEGGVRGLADWFPPAVLSASVLKASREALVVYAGIILAFIGGLQQTAAVHANRPTATPVVVGGIAIALASFAALLASQLLGATRSAAAVLAFFYSLQALLERAPLLPPCSKPLMLPEARATPMFVAVVAVSAATLDSQLVRVGTPRCPHRA